MTSLNLNQTIRKYLGIINKKIQNITNHFNIVNHETFNIQQNIKLNVPYASAKPGDCGIGSISMLLQYRRISIPSVKILSKKFKVSEFHDDNIGWKHDGLIAIMNSYNIKSYRKKNQSISDIIKSLQEKRPVIVSLRVPEIDNLTLEGLYLPKDPKKKPTGHLCVVVGVNPQSIVLHDPRNIEGYSDNVIVPFSDFTRIFTGRCIYLK